MKEKRNLSKTKKPVQKRFKKTQQDESWSTLQINEEKLKSTVLHITPADQLNNASQNKNHIKSWETKIIPQSKQNYDHC